MPVVVIGIEHSKAPFELLERVTVTEPEVGKVLTSLSARDNVREVALVSTCLRTEVYAVVDRFHDAVDDVLELLAERSGEAKELLEEHQSVYFDRGVASHLFKVAAGLESAVPGETEVLGQVRRSMERATDEGTIGPALTGLFRAALSAGRRARAETAIARGTTSFSHAAVALADDRLGGELAGAKVVVLGAGDLGAGTLGALIETRRQHRPAEIVLVNRTTARAADVLKTTETDLLVRAAPIEELVQELEAARLLITAIDSDEPVVDAAMLRAAGGRLLVLDLGMPRNVAPEAESLEGVDLLDIGHLHLVVDAAREERRSEMAAAQAVVTEEVDKYQSELRGRGAAPIVVALRDRLEALRAVLALTRSLVAKIAHEPTVALKESAGTTRGERLIEATRELFDL